jgi:F-type H+-transporting ATPase subunit delta
VNANRFRLLVFITPRWLFVILHSSFIIHHWRAGGTMREQNIPIFETYAAALLDAVTRAGQLDAAFQEAIELRKVLAANKALPRLLEKPAILKEEKQALLRRVFEGRLSPLMLNLALLLVDKNRGGAWDGILEYFVRSVEEKRGIRSGQVTTAKTLAADERIRLQAALEKFTGGKLRIDYRQDAEVLGGVMFRAGDLMIDTTIRGFMKELRNRLHQIKVEVAGGEAAG